MMATAMYRELKPPIDTMLIAGGAWEGIEAEAQNAELLRWLRDIAPSVRRLGSVCTGAFILASAGLLRGKRATTHWSRCAEFATRYPETRVDPDPIFVHDAGIYTSAGVTAGMDLALALVEEDSGTRTAARIARELVLYLRRPGGQAQLSAPLALQIAVTRTTLGSSNQISELQSPRVFRLGARLSF